MTDPTDFMYKDAVGLLARRIEGELLRLEAIYNFDHGAEFEVALCHVLRAALPRKYGVCRGHVVTAGNETAGDDIIVFDRNASPTLRMLDEHDFSRKEYVPVEGLLAYVEAKHTLHLDDASSFSKACQQVAAVKQLPRAPRPHSQILRNLTLESSFLKMNVGGLEHPELQNPMIGAIFSRRVAWEKKVRKASELVDRPVLNLGVRKDLHPEVLVAGNDMIGLPIRPEVEGDPRSDLGLFRGGAFDSTRLFLVEGRALALGIVCLLNLIDTVRLGAIDWKPVIVEQLNRGVRPK